MSKFKKILQQLNEKQKLETYEQEAVDALNKWKEKVYKVFPELVGKSQLKNMKLIFSDSIDDEVAAQAYRASNTIEMSRAYLKKHREEVLGQILGHEVMHIVHDLLYPMNAEDEDVHPEKWKDIMVKFGLRPEAEHEMDL